MHDDNLLKEYEIANENLRYCGNLKLAEVTVFVAVTGGLLAALFGLDEDRHASGEWVLKVFGLLTSVCFLLILESTQFAWFHFARRAAELEVLLGFRLWSVLPGAPLLKFRPSSWALRFFYFCVVMFWVVSLWLGDLM